MEGVVMREGAGLQWACFSAGGWPAAACFGAGLPAGSGHNPDQHCCRMCGWLNSLEPLTDWMLTGLGDY